MAQRYVPVYDAYEGGWSLPADPQVLVMQNPDGSSPKTEDFIKLADQLFANQIISPADQAQIQNMITRMNIPQESMNTLGMIIGMLYMYDCYRLLATDEIGKDKYNLTKQDRMRARNRAALIAITLGSAGPAWEPVIREIYNIFHVKRGVTRAEMLEEMTEPGPWSEVNEGVLPRIDTDGYGTAKDKTPWSRDWNVLTPELAARAVGLLKKTTKKGITLDPDTLAKAAQGYVPGEEELSAANAKATKRKESRLDVKLKEPTKPKPKPAAAAERGGKKQLSEREKALAAKLKALRKKMPKIEFVEEDIEPEERPRAKKAKPKASRRKIPKIEFVEEDIEPEERPKAKTKAKKRRPKIEFVEEDIEPEPKPKKKKKKGGSALWDSFYSRTGGYRSGFQPSLLWTRI